MTEKKLYTCDICHTDYASADAAHACESNHKLLEKATITGEYKAKGVLPDGAPVKIRVKFPNTSAWIEYHR